MEFGKKQGKLIELITPPLKYEVLVHPSILAEERHLSHPTASDNNVASRK